MCNGLCPFRLCIEPCRCSLFVLFLSTETWFQGQKSKQSGPNRRINKVREIKCVIDNTPFITTKGDLGFAALLYISQAISKGQYNLIIPQQDPQVSHDLILIVLFLFP